MILQGLHSKPGRALRLALLVLHISVVGLAPAVHAESLAHSRQSQPLQTPGEDSHSHHDPTICPFCELIAISGTPPVVAIGYVETPRLVDVSIPTVEQHCFASAYHSTTRSRAPPQA